MQTILIPTDFSAPTFDCMSLLCSQNQSEELTLVFAHLFKLSDSIGDLLMLSRRSREYEYVGDAFYQQCEALKVQYPNIRAIKIEFFYGSTVVLFKEFLEFHEITGILHSSNCSWSSINSASINPNVLAHKLGLPDVVIRRRPAGIPVTETLRSLREEIVV
jgi:hypothetical protein